MAANEPRWYARVEDSLFISHWRMTAADIEKLVSARRLALWNVKFPSGFRFSDLAELEFLDLRGGTKTDLSELEDCLNLQGLVVNQVRGLADITALSGLTGLRILSLYGLAKVEGLPDMSGLTRLERLDLGQMRSLTDWRALTTPPELRQVFFANLLHPDPDVIDELARHLTVREFEWYAPDVPLKAQDPIRRKLSHLAATRAIRPEDWLKGANDS